MDAISRTVARLELFRRYDDGTETGSASATGFFWRIERNIFLITNWHNVTGRNSFNGNYIGTFAPTHMRFEFFGLTPGTAENKHNMIRRTRATPLFDSNEVPLWHEHPLGRQVDVVAIPVTSADIEGLDITTINELPFETRWTPSVRDDCFIVGYPEGLPGPAGTPIYKRSSVATEPDAYPDHTHQFLVDTLGNFGMSGSPVIGRSSGIFSPTGGQRPALTDIIGTWENFSGVYCGRVGDDKLGLQLGRVHKPQVISEIVSRVSKNAET